MQTQFTKEAERLTGASVGALRVRDMMTTDLFTLYEDDTLQELHELMEWRGIRHVPVLNQANELTGLISERDFLKVSISALAGIEGKEANELYSHIHLRDMMGRHIKTISPGDSLSSAASVMIEHKFGCLPVMEGGKLVGILTEADFVKCFAS